MSRPILALTTLLGVAVLLAGATAPTALGAQASPLTVLHAPSAVPVASPVGEASAPAAGPWVSTVAFRVATPATPESARLQDEANVRDANVGAGRNLALMGVGAAAVAVGLLVGDTAGTAIAVGGGLLGLYGLYLFLK